MNLFGLANGAIQAVNANQTATWIQSTGGYTIDAAGHRTEVTTSTTVSIQVQGMTAGDLRLVDSLNLMSVKNKIFMYGDVQGINRSDQRGGDLLQFTEVPNGPVKTWKVVAVLENWSTWASVIVVLQ